MNKVEVINGLNKTIEGLMLLRDAISNDNQSVSMVPSPEKTDVIGTPSIPIAMDGKFERSQLDAMPYNEFKKLAARLGVKCTGTRDQITERVLALHVKIDGDNIAVKDDPDETKEDTEKTTKKLERKSKTSNPAPVEEPEVQSKSQPKSDKLSGSKRGLKKASSVPAEDEFDIKAKEVADNTSVEDIIAALSEVGVKANAKNFLPKLADALRKNLLSIDDDDEDSAATDTTSEDVSTSDETPDEGAENEVEFESDSYFSQYDPDGFNDPANMSEERQEAIVAKMDGILTAVSEGELTFDTIQTYLEENATQEELDLLGDEPTDDDMLMLYMELQKRLIDNEGDTHESSDPYELGEVDMCCGHKLKFVEETKKYVCEMCGTEYEAE